MNFAIPLRLIIIFITISSLLIAGGLFILQDGDNFSISAPSVTIDGIKLNVDIVQTPEEKSIGLSGRNSLKKDEGMLFIYDKPDFYSFWMKDMNFSIDIIWIGEDFQVVDITKNFKPESFPQSVQPQEPAQYLVEVSAGWVDEHRIHIGSPVSFNNVRVEILETEDTSEIFKDENLDTVQKISQLSGLILFDVPFTPQAPFGDWDDVRQQNACEEASIIMAMRWVEGTSLSKEEARREIIAISDFEQKTYGHFHDSSASDTAQLIIDYFGYRNVEFKSNIDASDIKVELANGNLVIVPVNGQKLRNPFYTPPGPLEHMLVVIGYDAQSKEFITNDSGTRRGEKFRYSEDILEEALQDYPTGFHEPIIDINKVMIVVKPPS